MRKIDGRKAEIINKGQTYTTYRSFANKHGYPDAAMADDSTDKRKALKDGDVVTLLTSGPHEYDSGGMLWIVETANDERYIIGEKGLRILSEELSENVTVLSDESLGGVQREYREVIRKARVGERIKIVESMLALNQYENGDVLAVRSAIVPGYWDNVIFAENVGVGIRHEEYVVLEPTDILRIDGGRFRMVDRKAAVGERVIIVNNDWPSNYDIGEVFTVNCYDAETETMYGGICVNELRNRRGVNIPGFVQDGKYRVLEPVASAPLSAQPPLDQAAATIGALQAQIQALESRVSTLEQAQSAAAKVDDEPPSFSVMPRAKSAQDVRDAVVERAKADVKALADSRGRYRVEREPGAYLKHVCVVEFVVSRDKRKVTAILRGVMTGIVRAVGRAKCAPNDVFNAHIGRAIALRRALGLEVPAEYMSVPNPEEPRVGDVVKKTRYSHTGKFGKVSAVRPSGYADCELGLTFIDESNSRTIWAHIKFVKIIDDSREEVAE